MRLLLRIVMRRFALAAALVLTSGRLLAQAGPPAHDMSQHRMATDSARDGWTTSLSARAFVQYVDQSTKRGDRQFGITDWEMLMASRRAGPGTLRLSAMTSIGASIAARLIAVARTAKPAGSFKLLLSSKSRL